MSTQMTMLSSVPIKRLFYSLQRVIGNRFKFQDSKVVKCWKCGAIGQSEQLFCDHCRCLQEPNKDSNYFDVIGIEKDYDINNEELTQRFKKMQNLLHPDRFSTKDRDELAISENFSALVNEAYTTLQNPLQRGLYLLRLQGLSIEEGSVQTDPAFLLEIMERNEEFSEVKDAERLHRVAKENQMILSDLSRQISTAFKEEDVQQAKLLLSKMKYYWRFAKRIKELEQEMGIVH